jgi:hypothetical protein
MSNIWISRPAQCSEQLSNNVIGSDRGSGIVGEIDVHVIHRSVSALTTTRVLRFLALPDLFLRSGHEFDRLHRTQAIAEAPSTPPYSAASFSSAITDGYLIANLR